MTKLQTLLFALMNKVSLSHFLWHKELELLNSDHFYLIDIYIYRIKSVSVLIFCFNILMMENLFIVQINMGTFLFLEILVVLN